MSSAAAVNEDVGHYGVHGLLLLAAEVTP